VASWDPNWRPDPTGQRIVAIRDARRGALAAALIFGILVVIAAEVAPQVASTAGIDTIAGSLIALISLPGLALLGAGLTSAALGPRWTAVSAGVAMGVGVPVAAVTSAMIGAFIVVGISHGASSGGDAAGTLLRAGVTAAVRISPLIALGSVGWVLVVRRVASPRRSGDDADRVPDPDRPRL
jgi:hypothetical protein